MASLPGLLGGSTTLRGAIIKAGNRPAVLVEDAWTYRLPGPSASNSSDVAALCPKRSRPWPGGTAAQHATFRGS
jgi:hypothetical protein